MGSDEQPSIAAVGDEVRQWVDGARAALAARHHIANAAESAASTLRQRAVQVRRNNRVLCRVMPLRGDDVELIRSVARQSCLPPVSPDVQRELGRLTQDVARATQDLRAVTGFQRFFKFGGSRERGHQAAQFLADYRRWFLSSGMREAIHQATPVEDHRIQGVGIEDALCDWVGFAPLLANLGESAVLEGSASFATLPNAVAVVRRASAEEARLRAAAVNVGNRVRQMETDRMLADMPVERLREATRDKIRVSALIDNDIRTVLAVLANEHRLETFDGIGETTAMRIRGAARALRQNTFDEMPMRIDIKNRTPEHTEFLRSLRAWDAARRASASSTELSVVDEMSSVAAVIDKSVTHAIVMPSSLWTVADFREAVQSVARSARSIADARDAAQSSDPWDDFMARPADYFALLAELGFITEDDEKTHGDLPVEIVEAVREFELKGDFLTASLRGYQSFAAKFALVQRKVIIGDEMGLGKTVEAIAVLTHLRAKGSHHFLVVCPAAVVTNWVREVAAKSTLSAHRLHGSDRQWAAKNWIRNGGVAVTTFETLPWLKANVASMPQLGCVVADEAHYIKNPDALRTQRTVRLTESCERAVFLTGTPLENRIDEFRNLVGYLRPDLVLDANEFAPKKFRRQVAPAYLRRNQEDVLTELPELVEVEEWLTMSGEDFAAYRAAVEQRNFMAMRQAAMSQGRKSAKMERLIEIVDEAEANGRRVVVFSYFLDVLKQVAALVPGRVHGPLTGSVAASRRQIMVDEFSSAENGAVLVAQILAGGVGLNIQAASVVVICEPQLKPTTEWQAIARAHRMGQLESVQVHRLLSDEGIDQRIREILARKQEVFESFARKSETAQSAPEAYDVSEAELAREIIAAERERLFGQGAPAGAANRPTGEGKTDERVDGHEPQEPPAASTKPPQTAPRVAPQRVSARKREETAPSPNGQISSAAPNSELKPYPVFAEKLRPISQTPADRVAENVARIVAVEGPVTGWRIHEIYKKSSGGRESHDVFSRLLNRAISAAERGRLIVSDNPFNQTGNKPRTFRLRNQPQAIVRQLGPRTIDIVPPVELAQYCREVANGEPLAEDEMLLRVAKLLGLNQVPPSDRNALLAAKRLLQRTTPNSSSAQTGAVKFG